MKLNLGNEESERTQATAAKAGRPSRVGQPRHRLLPSIRRRIRRPVGGTGPANSPAGEPSSLGRRPAQGAGPHLRQRHIHGIFYVLRTGCQWKALDATGICSGSTAHLRFQEWVAAGVFLELWRTGLERYDELQGLDWDWDWLSMDGAMTKSPLGGGENRSQPHGPG